jgi:hypothetical protein
VYLDFQLPTKNASKPKLVVGRLPSATSSNPT